MIFLLPLLIALSHFSTPSFANDCTVFVPSTEWNYEGYPIKIGKEVADLLTRKNYTQITDAAHAHYILDMTVEQQIGQMFNHAVALYSWNRVDSDTRVAIKNNRFTQRCWTALCSIYDFPKPLQKMMADLEQSIPSCQ